MGTVLKAGSEASIPTDRVCLLVHERLRHLLRRRRQARSSGTPGLIHDVRVATRRLQEALEVFAKTLPAREAKRLGRRARRIRKDLAEVRDTDMLLDLVARLEGRASAGRRSSLPVLKRRLEARAGRLRLALRGAAAPASGRPAGLRLAGIRKRARLLLRAMRPIPPHEVERAARAALARRRGELARALRESRGGGAVAIHRLRIAVKRYRYTLEIVEAAGAMSLAPALREARGLQETLGALHDLDVLLTLARRTRMPPETLRLLRAERRERALAAAAQAARFRPVAPGRVGPGGRAGREER